MPKDRKPLGPCEQCSAGHVTCTHNFFSNGTLDIDSWEHRCSDCSYRVTEAYRRGVDEQIDADPKICPFCQRQAPAYGSA